MGNKLTTGRYVSSLAQELGLEWFGEDILIETITSLSSSKAGALCFSKDRLPDESISGVILIASQQPSAGYSATVIVSENPRLSFARALIALDCYPGFIRQEVSAQISESAEISPGAFIGKDVVIGDKTCIGHNVVIADGTHIGSECYIKSGSVIGEPGFGFERDESGNPVRILHLGNVTIGDRVEIGSLTTVCRGTLDHTIIEDDVKIDDHVHVAHNCHIRRGTLVTACSELSGGVDVGEYSWIGPNSSIIQKVKLGRGCFVGIASSVRKDVSDGDTVAGNPAKVLQVKS